MEPQFVVGPAVVYALRVVGRGSGGALVLPAVAMGLALLALGLLVARVAGPWAGVATAALTGILFPVLHTARATYSEPLAMLTLAAGLLAATLARPRGSGGCRGEPGMPAARASAGFVGDASPQGMVVGRAPLRVARACVTRRRGPGLLAGLLVGGTGLRAGRRAARGRAAAAGARPGGGVRGAVGASAARRAGGVAGGVGGGRGGAVVAVPRVDRGEPACPWLVLGVLVGGGSWVGPRAVAAGLAAAGVRRAPPAGRGRGARRAGGALPREPAAVAGRPPGPGRPGRALRRRDAGAAGAAGRRGPHLRRADRGVAVLVRRAGRARRGPRRAGPARAARLSRRWARSGRSRGCRPSSWRRGRRCSPWCGPASRPDHPWADRRLLVALPLVVALVVVGRRLAGAARERPPAVGGSGSGPRRSSWRHPRRRARPSSPRGRTGPVASSVGRWPPSSRCAARWRPATSCSRSTHGPPTSGRRSCEACAGSRPCRSTSRVRSDDASCCAVDRVVGSLRASRSAGAGSCCSLPTRRRPSTALGVTPTVRSSRSPCARTSTSSSGGPARTDPLPVAVWLAPPLAGPPSPGERRSPAGASHDVERRPAVAVTQAQESGDGGRRGAAPRHTSGGRRRRRARAAATAGRMPCRPGVRPCRRPR